jgi:hypothetical protein
VKTLTAISFFVFSTMAVAQSTDQRLEAFNRSPAWENSSGETSDNPSLVKPFQGKKFICRDEASFTPKENDTASAAFRQVR